MEPLETITVDTLSVACDGGGGALGHPRVFLNLERRGAVDCPYCGRRFVLAEDSDAGEGIPAPEHDLPPAV